MVNRKKLKKKKRPKTVPLFIGDSIFTMLEQMGGNRKKSLLNELWQNWELIVGREISDIASPAGHKGETLLLAVEDSLQMQEMHMLTQELLERVNAFLQTDYFKKVKIGLGKNLS